MSRRHVFSLIMVLLGVSVIASPAAAQWVTNGAAVCIEPFEQMNAVAAADGAGGIIVAWEDYRAGGSGDIYAQRLDAAGNPLWTPGGIPVCAIMDHAQSGRIVSDGAGGAIVLWQDYRAGSSNIYAQRLDAGGNALWTADGVLVCGADNDQDQIAAIPDGSGGAFVAWQDWRNIGYDIYAQRIDAGGNMLWTTGGVPVVTRENDQFSAKIVSDRLGGVVVAWLDCRNGFYEVFTQRLASNGAALWPADGIPVYLGTYQNDFDLICDGASVTFAWQEYRGMYDDVFLQRFDMDGVRLWAPDGVAASPYESYKYSPRIVEDLDGGALVAWYDSRGDNYSVYAQRVNASGEPLWVEEGVMVFNTAGSYDLRAIPDGAGGVIVPLDVYVWELDENNIYAQRLDANGILRWPLPYGAAVCTAQWDQYSPIPVSDGSGGVIVAWEDYRNEDRDIYAQRVGPSGLWGNPDPAIVSCIDIPSDQGGWVRITTRASALDTPMELLTPIMGYNVWRAIEEEEGGEPVAILSGDAAEDRSELLSLLSAPDRLVGTRLDASSAALLGLPEGDWESVGFWFATWDTVYHVGVPTRNDSTDAGIPWETYMVTAHTTKAGLFVASETSSGYSVDNLAPGVTAGFAGDETAEPAGLNLTWTANAASDLAEYEIYRGLDALFPIDASSLLASTTGTEYLDETWLESYGYFYKLVAVDRHGNRSPAALLAPEDVNVGTLLQNFAASLSGTSVEISWRLVEIDEGALFEVLRADGKDAPFEALAEAEIVREGLSFTFVDRSIEPGTVYVYRVDVIDGTDRRTLFETEAIETPAMPFTLHQNHPNPFNPSTVIEYYLPAASPVTLEIFDAAGRLVSRLVEGAKEERGMHAVEWRGVDDRGRGVSSGVYFYRLKAGRDVRTRKMVLLR